MKDLKLYLFSILFPVGLLYLVLIYMNSTAFVGALFAYCLAYRPSVDFKRLSALGLIELKDYWKLYIPFYRFKFFKALYFGL
ncbi:MAG TPA: hypothetical protein PKL31_08740 [Fulvivirga sp.]|nr:hypothetical protein [Fulvivirga sp.]